MDGVHDLGGMHGFGPIDRSQEEHFPRDWEKQVFQMTLVCGMLGKWNLDMTRSARERMDPAHYLGSSYYEHWYHGLETMLLEKGLLTAEEIHSGRTEAGREYEPVPASRVPEILARGGPTLMNQEAPAKYSPGDSVRIVNEHPRGHTRMPRYIRGRVGQVLSHHGAHIFPDEHADSGNKLPRHLYGIQFAGEELWGADSTEPNTAVIVDVFEPYIEGMAA